MFFKIAAEAGDYQIICDIAGDCQQALDLLINTSEPDYIFLDLNMPKMDGRTCLKELKSKQKTSQIPVIIFSTSSQHTDKVELKTLGADDFITKPTHLDLLTEDLNNLLHKHSSNKF